MRRQLALAVVSAILWAANARAQQDPLESWRRNHWGIEPTATVHDCLACHGQGELRAHAGHPVDVEYGPAAARPRASLRPLQEAVRRGVLLPDGKLHCYTCHDPRSPWHNHLAIPPGTTPRASVVIGVEASYATERSAPAAGAEVSPTPLCQACHTYGD